MNNNNNNNPTKYFVITHTTGGCEVTTGTKVIAFATKAEAFASIRDNYEYFCSEDSTEMSSFDIEANKPDAEYTQPEALLHFVFSNGAEDEDERFETEVEIIRTNKYTTEIIYRLTK